MPSLPQPPESEDGMVVYEESWVTTNRDQMDERVSRMLLCFKRGGPFPGHLVAWVHENGQHIIRVDDHWEEVTV